MLYLWNNPANFGNANEKAFLEAENLGKAGLLGYGEI